MRDIFEIFITKSELQEIWLSCLVTMFMNNLWIKVIELLKVLAASNVSTASINSAFYIA